jgi:YD repeat-containing protein
LDCSSFANIEIVKGKRRTPKSQITTSAYTNEGLVSTVTRPAVNGTSPVTKYTYESVKPAGTSSLNVTHPVRHGEDGQPGMGDANNYEQYTWDANGNLTALRKRDGQTVAQSFDALDRLSTRTFPGSVGNVQYSYDLRGLKTASQYSDGSHTITNSYDGLGQLTRTGAAGRAIRYTRDTAGNVTDIAWPDGFHVGTTYDSYRRPLQMLENGTANLAKYSYDTLNRRTQVDRPSCAIA